jgi:hypothetical protein
VRGCACLPAAPRRRACLVWRSCFWHYDVRHARPPPFSRAVPYRSPCHLVGVTLRRLQPGARTRRSGQPAAPRHWSRPAPMPVALKLRVKIERSIHLLTTRLI